MQTASVFVVLPATLFAKCCPVQGLLYRHVPSHPPAPNPPLSKREQRRPASFRFALMPPFKGYRKRNRVTDLNHRGSHSSLGRARQGVWRGEWPSQACAWGLSCDAQGHGLWGLLCTQVACSLLSSGSATTFYLGCPHFPANILKWMNWECGFQLSTYLTETTFWPCLGGNEHRSSLSYWAIEIEPQTEQRMWKAPSPAKQS